jgi:hypothetical protein
VSVRGTHTRPWRCARRGGRHSWSGPATSPVLWFPCCSRARRGEDGSALAGRGGQPDRRRLGDSGVSGRHGDDPIIAKTTDGNAVYQSARRRVGPIRGHVALTTATMGASPVRLSDSCRYMGVPPPPSSALHPKREHRAHPQRETRAGRDRTYIGAPKPRPCSGREPRSRKGPCRTTTAVARSS